MELMQNSNRFKTNIIDLKSIINDRFIIPTYQRPYVWKDEQISKLLNDCIVAFREHSETPYYIGTILTNKKQSHYELIDGQQRFITLWLIALVFHRLGEKSKIVSFLKYEEQLRIGFEIREEITKYFKDLEKSPSEIPTNFPESDINKSIYLKDIAKALTTIQGVLSSVKSEVNLINFGDYIFEKVKMINNIAPCNTNLNKLFATINNSGIQLEQTDIVKANLLKRINSDRLIYSKMWESCENMNDFFERNICKIFTETHCDNLFVDSFSEYDKKLFVFKRSEEADIKSITENTVRSIIDNIHYSNESIKTDEVPDKNYEIYARSIISFGQLLLHTYRIYLHKKNKSDFEGSFHTSRLIDIFKELEKDSEDEIKSFFELLWQVRFTFDKYIVKWIADSNSKEERLELTTVTENTSNGKKYFGRNEIAKNSSLMLQSVLYFTGDSQRQYWLTPLLYGLIQKKYEKEESLELLETIDNYISLSSNDYRDASWILCDSNNPDIELNYQIIETELNSAKGTGFRHYWFQKLEYILWKEWDKNDNKITDFKITSKNSIEHVFPQHHEFRENGMTIEDKVLNSFGNLGLLSVSQNSSYSNQDVQKKKVDFYNKKIYDSLKLALIYNDGDISNWNKDRIFIHQKSVIERIIHHYKK